MTAELSSPSHKQDRVGARRALWKRPALWAVGLLVGLLLAMVSCSPATPVSQIPDARQADGARLAFEQVKAAVGAGAPVTLTFDRDRFEGSAVIAARTLGIKRLAVNDLDDGIAIETSVPLAGPLWLNVAARPRPSAEGFPPIPMTVGRVPVPAFVTRAGLEAARLVLRLRGRPIPELDTVVRSFDVRNREIVALVEIPRGSGLQQAFATLQADPIDAALVARHYCRLAQAQREAPAPDLTSQIRRAFKDNASTQDNRAAFVALAMLAVSPKVGDIAGDAATRVKSCRAPYVRFTLLGRGDLAKHWTMSAALASAYGGDVSDRIGVWKEVSDSAVPGTGFSFVDLSANRSGIAYALKSADARSHAEVTAKLERATDATILPVAMLALAEGLSEEEFLKRFVSIESPEYRAVRTRIDRTLAIIVDDRPV